MSSPNVLLVILDSVRAKNTSLHDARHETTPFLSSLAADAATQYTQARAPSQWSLPSHTSMFTGYHVPEHGVTAADAGIRSGETIFDELNEAGYETGLFSENPYLTSLETGLDSGFDTVAGASREPLFEGANPDEFKGDVGGFLQAALGSGRPARSLANGMVAKLAWDYPDLLPDRLERRLGSGTVPGSTFTDLFLDWVEGTDEPWAGCINFMDAHHPYLPNAEFDKWNDGAITAIQQSIDSMPLGFYDGSDEWWKCELLEYLYDGTIRQLDREVQRLVKALRERGDFENTLLIVTSDHGEGFGERSRLRNVRIAGHNVGETEENLHVPLVVSHPEQDEGGVVDAPATLTAIPRAVRRAVEGERDLGAFTEPPVVARTQGMLAPQQGQLSQAGIDIDPLVGESDVLYESGDDFVYKQARWNDRTLSVRSIDAATNFTDRGVGVERIQSVFDGFEDAGIRIEADQDTITEATERRLENLGYR
ncbi:sulfatase [Haloterrigena salina]|nr:sulfatase [Haloterrigena salina]